MSSPNEASDAESASTIVAESTPTSLSKDVDTPSAPGADATASREEGARKKRTPLPFWRMIRANGSTYYLPYTRGQRRPVPEDPTDEMTINDLLATRRAAWPARRRVPLTEMVRRRREHLAPVGGRLCTTCRKRLPLAHFRRSYHPFDTVSWD